MVLSFFMGYIIIYRSAALCKVNEWKKIKKIKKTLAKHNFVLYNNP